jgi:peptidoglycan/LPS O-acetylase OafA/YrhL
MITSGNIHGANNFDILRLIAAWLILFGHSFELFNHSPDPLAHYLRYETITSIALNIFFVISGYLVTASYLNHESLIKFARNRFLRLIPALVAVTLFSIFLLGALTTKLSLAEYFSHVETWKYLNNILIFPLHYSLPEVFNEVPYANVVNGSLWSLEIEVRAYILVGLLGFFRLLRGNVVISVMLLLLVIFAWFTFVIDPEIKRIAGVKTSFILSNSRWLFGFFAGCALYILREKVPYTPPLFVLVFILSIIAWYYLPYGKLIHMLCMPYLILHIALATKPVGYLLKGKDLSYGIYLYAFPMQQLTMQITGTQLGIMGFIAMASLLTFICAWLSWHYVEQPFLKRKQAPCP